MCLGADRTGRLQDNCEIRRNQCERYVLCEREVPLMAANIFELELQVARSSYMSGVLTR